MLLPAAAVAWQYVQAGTPEAAPNYKTTDHWWGMLIDITECIGCGSCVRACAEENDVPEGYYRTWIERYHVADWKIERPRSSIPRRRQARLPSKPRHRRQEFLCPQALQPLRRFPLHSGLSRWRDLRLAGWRRPCRQKLLPRLPLLRASVSLRLPLHQPQNQHSGEMFSLLPPHHKRFNDGLLRGLPHRRPPTRRSEESQRPDS